MEHIFLHRGDIGGGAGAAATLNNFLRAEQQWLPGVKMSVIIVILQMYGGRPHYLVHNLK